MCYIYMRTDRHAYIYIHTDRQTDIHTPIAILRTIPAGAKKKFMYTEVAICVDVVALVQLRHEFNLTYLSAVTSS